MDSCRIALVIVSSILALLIIVILIAIVFYGYQKHKSTAKEKRNLGVKNGPKQSIEKKAELPIPKLSETPAQEPAKKKSNERRAEEGAADFVQADIPKPKSKICTQPTQMDTFKKPENDTMADARDPNYRSMKGIGNDVFNVPPKPTENADDQYEVLSNLQNFIPVHEVKTPAAGDQYESLADLNNQEIINKKAVDEKNKPKENNGKSTKVKDKISNKEGENKSAAKALDENKVASPDVLPPPPPPPPPKKKGPAFKRPDTGKVSSKNPQYETFAGISDAIFQGAKKPE